MAGPIYCYSPDRIAVAGESFTSTGVFGKSTHGWAVHGRNEGGGQYPRGVFGESSAYNGAYPAGVYGWGLFGVVGETRYSTGAGVLGRGHGSAPAGGFSGNVWISGQLTKGSGGFRIDHPLAPAEMYLNHSFVESDEMKNVYDGVAELNDDGEASVDLPKWFEALNEDFRYQLTAVGGAAPNLHVAEEISENRFRIAGGEGGMKVCWQVTGSRKDAFARANSLEVEEAKPPEERGRYLHPRLYNMPEEQMVIPGGQPQIALGSELQQVPETPPRPEEDMYQRQLDDLRQQIEELRSARVEDERQREMDDLRRQIEELWRRRK